MSKQFDDQEPLHVECKGRVYIIYCRKQDKLHASEASDGTFLMEIKV
jgi:hypothetical protein